MLGNGFVVENIYDYDDEILLDIYCTLISHQGQGPHSVQTTTWRVCVSASGQPYSCPQ